MKTWAPNPLTVVLFRASHSRLQSRWGQEGKDSGSAWSLSSQPTVQFCLSGQDLQHSWKRCSWPYETCPSPLTIPSPLYTDTSLHTEK